MKQSLNQAKILRTRLLALFTFLGIALIFVALFLIDSINEKKQLTTHLENIQRSANQILYYDEVLTNSARLYIFDQQHKWSERYEYAAQALDKTLAFSATLDPQIKDAITATSKVNEELIEIELIAFQLADQGKQKQAQAMLFGSYYEDLKKQYEGFVKQVLQQVKTQTITRIDEQNKLREQILIVLFILLSFSLVALLFYLFKHFKYTDGVIEQLMNSLKEQLEESQRTTIELEKANQSKNLFLANMSHELRTPMNGIYGVLQLLLDRPLDENSLQLLTSAVKSAKMLSVIVDDILDSTKLEANKLELEQIDFDLFELTAHIEDIFHRECLHKDVKFSLQVDVQNHYRTGDPYRIKQILLNLLNNAVKFTQHGEVCFSVYQQPNSNNLIFNVRDTGIGMDSNELACLFNSFEQADLSTTRKYGGTGLGMFIVKGLVDKMQGTITVKSKKMAGTQITCVLPLIVAEKCDTALLPEQGQKELLQGLRILVAEDNRVNQMVIKKMLEHVGCYVHIVSDGVEAVAHNLHNIDIVLLDIHMPNMDGIKACQLIKQKQQTIPIIAVTASVLKGDIEHYKTIGFDDVVKKPIEKTELYDKLSRMLELNQQIDKLHKGENLSA